MSENILTLTDAGFEADVLKAPAGKPVFVDFWAPWCGPCRMLAPRLEQAAETFDGRVVIAKYNCDEASRFAGEYNVRGIPTVIAFKNGQHVGERTGLCDQETLNAFIEAHL